MQTTTQLDPTAITQLGFGFLASKTLLSAVELGLFTLLARKGPQTAAGLAQELGLHPRAVPDFPDTLVALKMLRRDGEHYSNTPETEAFLNRESPQYIGGIFEMSEARLYPFWAHLTEALKTGKPQNEAKHGEPLFAKLYETPEQLEGFMNAMSGISAGNFMALPEKFDFSRFQTLCDVGGATALLACRVAQRHPHLRCQSFDLPKVKPIAQRRIDAEGLAARVVAVEGDFFKDDLPEADVITMGMVLHDWNLETKRMLIRKAYEALPAGGAFIAIEQIIDDERRENAAGLLMSLNMLIETGDGFDYTGQDFAGWAAEAGFARTEILHLVGPASAAIAWKA